MGLSRQGNMGGADIVLGGVYPSGRPYFGDYHAQGNQRPIRDRLQDWELRAAWENKTHTFLSFSRAFDTCDPQDLPIGDASLYFLWAYGARDNVTQYHRNNRGSSVVYLRDPDLTPRSIMEENGRNPDISTSERAPVSEGGTEVQIWTLKQLFQLPPQRTYYLCSLFKFAPSAAGQKHHLIGSNAIITPAVNMHHALFFRCRPPGGGNSAALFYEPFLDKPQECYALAQPLGPIQTQYCSELVLGHAIGGTPFFFNEQMGIPIGETAPEEYFLLQTHYDNPTMSANLTVDINWDLYYTPRLRENDGGVISVGHNIPGVPSLMMPPGEVDHIIYGHCSPSCTERILPPEGIHLAGALLHTHLAGRRIRIQHFRDGRELPWIYEDDNYQFSFQPFRTLREARVVLPGDQVTVQCYYDTSTNNRSLVAGYGTDQEMCKTFMVYWTRLEDYGICRSEIIDPDYQARYLAGTTDLVWDVSSLEYRATNPPLVAGRTVTNISDSELVHWDLDLRLQLRRDHISHPHVPFCPNLTALPLGLERAPPSLVSLPAHFTGYQPPERCALEGR